MNIKVDLGRVKRLEVKRKKQNDGRNKIGKKGEHGTRRGTGQEK